jgi:hypothetical protein
MFFSNSCSFFARFSGSAKRGERQHRRAQQSRGRAGEGVDTSLSAEDTYDLGSTSKTYA